MKRSSLTAVGIAAARAMERERPPAERIVDDPFARHFVGEFTYRLLSNMNRLGMGERRGPGVMGYLVVRERAIDDVLLQMLGDGISQLVILGAGYDARAYRFNRKLGGVTTFEVDHPATQASKRAKVEQFSDELTQQVTYVPVDFETQLLGEELLRNGYDPSRKTLFIWQGTVMYLAPEAVDQTLAFIRTHSAPGSAVVLDYVARTAIQGDGARSEVRRTNRYGRFTGEQIRSGLDPERAPAWLSERGFHDIVHMTSADLQARYFTGANAGRTVAAGYGILVGRV